MICFRNFHARVTESPKVIAEVTAGAVIILKKWGIRSIRKTAAPKPVTVCMIPAKTAVAAMAIYVKIPPVKCGTDAAILTRPDCGNKPCGQNNGKLLH